MKEDSVFYHGSKYGGLEALKPTPFKAVSDKDVVFASNNKLYALAMIYGTGEDLAVSFGENGEMYVDELKPGTLSLLNNSGYLYAVDKKYFKPSPEGLEGEYVSYTEVPVLSEEKLSDIRKKLEEEGVHLIPYNKVPQSMEERGKDIKDPDKKHSADRFK